MLLTAYSICTNNTQAISNYRSRWNQFVRCWHGRLLFVDRKQIAAVCRSRLAMTLDRSLERTSFARSQNRVHLLYICPRPVYRWTRLFIVGRPNFLRTENGVGFLGKANNRFFTFGSFTTTYQNAVRITYIFYITRSRTTFFMASLSTTCHC